VIQGIFSLLMRGVFVLAAVIFFASLALVAVLLLALWLLRALWARLTGLPVSPWVFQFNRQGVWQRFYPGSGQGSAASRSDADVIDVEIKDVTEIRGIKPPQS
jgi:hypothetical protein